MAFDIASVLAGAAVTADRDGREQITYLDPSLIVPDNNNFYSMEGIEELAGNIELIGLQQPLRVRRAPGDDRYIVVSGHRRREAILRILADRPDAFPDGIPCIIEAGEASEAMRELRLIYANAATRVMGPAEISMQAERVEALLYQLKEEGVEFPGRMRDHVAEACKVSKTKLARLHAIRNRLDPELLEAYFDKGLLPESVAYELSRNDQSTQRWIVDTYKATHPKQTAVDNLREWWVRDFAACAAKMAELHCRQIAGGGECIHQREHVEHVWRKGYEGYDGCVNSSTGSAPKCCAECDRLASCSASCSRCERQKSRLKADLKAQRQSERETKKADEENRKLQRELNESQAALYWARLGGTLKDAGTDFWTLQDSIDEDSYHTGKDNRVLCTWQLEPADIEALLDGRPAKNDGCEIPIPAWKWMDDDGVGFARVLCKMADLLGVSLDYLFLRTDNPKGMAVSGTDTGDEIPDPDAGWSTGKPESEGEYAVRSGIPAEEGPQSAVTRIVCWDGEDWVSRGTGVPIRENVYRWHRMPEV